MTVRIALFGNSFGARVQLPALRWAGDNRVVGLAGRDRAKAEATARAWDIPVGTDDWRELLLGSNPPDLVIVSTPVDLHQEMVSRALEAGAAVLCEKPFALNAGQAQELCALASNASGGAWLDHQLRWCPQVREIRRRLRSGELGELWHVRFDMLLPPGSFRQRPWSWWFQAERGGGILGALGSHMLDLLRYLLGEVDSVRAELATFVPERADPQGVRRPSTADEYAHLSLSFASGVVGEVTTSIALPSEPWMRLQITGSAGVLRWSEADELLAGPLDANEQDFERVHVDPPLPAAAEYGMEDMGVFARCLPLFLRDVVRSVAAGSRDGPMAEAATFADGLAVQRMLDAARVSARERGGWVSVRA